MHEYENSPYLPMLLNKTTEIKKNYFTASRPAQRPTKPMSTRSSSPGLKRPGREADHSSPSSAEIKNGGVIPPLPHVFMARCLIN
jgi:hypothetical protein